MREQTHTVSAPSQMDQFTFELVAHCPRHSVVDQSDGEGTNKTYISVCRYVAASYWFSWVLILHCKGLLWCLFLFPSSSSSFCSHLFLLFLFLILCHCACSHTQLGLTFTFAHVLVRALVDGPGYPSTQRTMRSAHSVLSHPQWPCK